MKGEPRLPRRWLLAASGVILVGATAALAARFHRPGASAIGIVAAADGDVRVNGALVPIGRALADGDEVKAVKGSAIILLRGDRSVVLREGAALVVADGGAKAKLLRGRARFEVVRSAGLPNRFSVDLGAAQVDVLGTVFAVERAWTDERVLVAVQEGRVRFNGTEGEVFLSAGEEATAVAGRVGPARKVSQTSLREDRAEPGLLKRLKQRAGKLVDDWQG